MSSPARTTTMPSHSLSAQLEQIGLGAVPASWMTFWRGPPNCAGLRARSLEQLAQTEAAEHAERSLTYLATRGRDLGRPLADARGSELSAHYGAATVRKCYYHALLAMQHISHCEAGDRSVLRFSDYLTIIRGLLQDIRGRRRDRMFISHRAHIEHVVPEARIEQQTIGPARGVTVSCARCGQLAEKASDYRGRGLIVSRESNWH